MNATLAARLNRPDLQASGLTATAPYFVGGGAEDGAYVPGSAQRTGLGLDRHGRVSAGLLIAITAGLVVFYVLTRSYQA